MLLLFLAFLIPVSVYCLVLGSINRRSHPLMVSGVWDCVGLLFAVSGFFLAVVPFVLNILYVKSLRQLPFEVESAEGLDAVQDLWMEWWGVLLLYYGLVLAGGGLLLWFRRNKTVIYNLELADFEKVFALILLRLGLERTRFGQQLILSPAAAVDKTLLMPAENVPDKTAPNPLPLAAEIPPTLARVDPFPAPANPHFVGPVPSTLVRIDPFPALANITLHWNSQAVPIRREVEAELAKSLQQIQTPENPAGTWILGIGGLLSGIIFLIVLVLVVLPYLPPRR